MKRLEANPEISQHELAGELGISLGRVNFCVQALIEKGLIKARNFRNSRNKKGYAYLLTPRGIEDKLLPLLLDALGERTSALIGNLDRVERLGLIGSADEWITIPNLRNQMVHEYIEDPVVLVSALQTGHAFVPTLIVAANKMIAEIEQRGWA